MRTVRCQTTHLLLVALLCTLLLLVYQNVPKTIQIVNPCSISGLYSLTFNKGLSAAFKTSPRRSAPLHKNITTTLKHTTTLVTRNLQCKQGLLLLILVTSNAWTGRERRLTIRETWGTYDVTRAGSEGHSWQTFFLIGTRSKSGYKNRYIKEAAIASLQTEMMTYNDVIEGDFVEEFYNLAHKLQMGFEWADSYCAFQYLLKTDDDIFVNTKKLLEMLSTLNLNNIYTGRVNWKDGINRNGKYGITYEEYNKTYYPPYVSGSTMIFSHDVIKRMVVSGFSSVKPFKLDDVYIGMVNAALNIKPTDVDPEDEYKYWDIWRYVEPQETCQWNPSALIRAVYFWQHDKRWCIYKMFHET